MKHDHSITRKTRVGETLPAEFKPNSTQPELFGVPGTTCTGSRRTCGYTTTTTTTTTEADQATRFKAMRLCVGGKKEYAELTEAAEQSGV